MNWKFWKKDDDYDLPDLSSDFDTPGTGNDPLAPPGMPGQPKSSALSTPSNDFSQPDTSSFDPQNPPQGMIAQPAEQPTQGTDLHNELILAKLEGIKNQLEILSHRMDKLDAQLSKQSQNAKGPWYAK